MLAVASAAGAAGPATITGKVVDENNVPVRQAVVTITPAAGADSVPIRATSDVNGAFQMEIPAPGDYRIEAEHEGFFVFTNRSASLDENSPLEIRMNHLKEMAESVDVHYSPPVIDPAQTSDTKQLNNQEILNIPYPASQDYRNALPLMPGAILDSSGQLHFNGGSTNQANYRLNGFDVSDPASGGLDARMNVDTIQTLEWDASRFSPEKGNGSAGTVDIKTEMGDDHWRFDGTNFVPGFSAQDGFYISHWSPRLKLSGPIRKGRAWFHNSMDGYYTVSTVTGLPSGQNRTRSFTGTDLTRIQWNLTSAHILTASFLANLGDNKRTGLSVLSPAETTLNQRTALFMGTAKDQWSVGGGVVELGFADSRTYVQSSPQGDQPYVVTPFGARGNYFAAQTTNAEREEWLVNGFLAPVKALGSHQIEIGGDIERSGLDQTIDRHEYVTVRADNSIVSEVQFLGSPFQFRHNLAAYTYALDRWSPLPTLTIEGGFRTQWDEFTGGAPPAPRVAASWYPKWAGGTKFSAGWGIFYDAITLNMIALSQEQASISTFYAPDGQIIGVPIESEFVLRPQDLRLPRFALTSFAAERKLPWSIYGKLNLIDRQGSNGFTFVDSAVSPSLNLYVLDNIERQTYRAAEFSIRRTFLSKYEWFASYTRSAASTNAAVNYSVSTPLFSPQAGGPLPWDAPNRILAWAWMPVEKNWFPRFLRRIVGDTDFQLMFEYRTGFPFSAVTETGTLAAPPDSFRFPNYASVNIAFERRFPFRGYMWAWRVGLVNALDRPNPNVVNNDANSPQFLTFEPGQARAVNVRLRFLGKK